MLLTCYMVLPWPTFIALFQNYQVAVTKQCKSVDDSFVWREIYKRGVAVFSFNISYKLPYNKFP